MIAFEMKPIPPADSDAWNVAEGKSGGKVTMIRYRPGLQDYLGDPRYPRRLTITWEYDDGNPSGLPSNDASDEMRVFEDALDQALDPERLAILAFVHTHGGARRWHYYLADVTVVGERINEALAEHPNLPIELEVEDDPEWDEMRLVFQGCQES